MAGSQNTQVGNKTQDSETPIRLSLNPNQLLSSLWVFVTLEFFMFSLCGAERELMFVCGEKSLRLSPTLNPRVHLQGRLRASWISQCRTSKGAGKCRLQQAARPKASFLVSAKALWGFSPSRLEELLSWCLRLDTVSSGRSDVMFDRFCCSVLLP